MADNSDTVKGTGTLSSNEPTTGEVGTIQAKDSLDQLPGAEHNGNVINWLGSSYSGSDIKVVAHLYGELDTAPEENRLKREKEFAEKMVEAFQTTMDAAGDIFDGRTTSYDDLIGHYDQEVTGAIFSFINTFNGITDPNVRASAMLNASLENQGYYQSIADDLQAQINRLEEIKKNGSSTLTLATLQTISVQSHREKVPVRAFGSSHVKGYTRGGRQIAGSMIFTMFNEHALAQLVRSMGSAGYKYREGQHIVDNSVSALLADQLPPLDITIVFANEYGSLSRAALY